MKLAVFALVLALAASLASCAAFRDDTEKPAVSSAETSAVTEAEPAATEAVSSEPAKTATAPSTELFEEEAPVGLYDELGEAGTYTRIEEWSAPWTAGMDIAVFDLIPSSHDTVSASVSYKELWSHHAAVLGEEGTVKPYVIFEYTTADGRSFSREIRSFADAEAVISEGFVELYLYDDVHQSDGAWYSHLTEYTTDADTVISSVKVTAGENIDSVTEMSLTACLDGVHGGKTVILRT